MKSVPEFLALTTDESRAVLARNHVGRLAFVNGAEVDIEPIGYVHDGDWVFARSGYGAKLEAIAHHPYVALEVDEIGGPFEWRSVVAHGTIYELPAEGSPTEREERRRAINAMRRVSPAAFTSRDPVPQRDIVYGMHVDRIEGRRAHKVDAPDAMRPRAPVPRPQHSSNGT